MDIRTTNENRVTVRTISLINVFLGLFIFISIIMIGAFLSTTVLQIKEQSSHTLTRFDNVLDRIELIPDSTWNFLNNQEEQTKLITMVKEVGDYWPKLRPFLNQTTSIPNVTWEFLTNRTEQTKLVNLIKYLINHFPRNSDLSHNSTQFQKIFQESNI